jgi:DNA polymerase
LVRLCQYCIQDVEAEYALAQELPPLPTMERRIWELDQTINDRGILCDLVSVEHAEAIIEAHEEKLLDELRDPTGLSSAKAVAALKGWLKDNDCGVEDLTKQSVGDALKGDLSPEARRVLEIRQSLGKSSTAKLAAFKAYACKDGRLRGMMLYHGAATGRWAGRGPQPHNLPRGDEIIAHLQDQSIALYPVRDPGLLDAVMGEPLNVISSCLRGMLVAAPGHDLIAADYSAIEARGLAYLAGEETVLDAFRNNLDLYKVAASGIYKKPYEQITKTERSVGKTCVLACGYGGSKGAMLAFGADRLGMSDEEIDSAVAAWRESNPNIVRFWYALTEACAKTVKEGVETRYRQIGFRMRGKFLQMILPSGRPLWYYAPRVQQVRMPWGKDKEMVTAMTVDSMTKQWVRRPLGHPILSENATQAFCRDLLALGLIRCEAAGYRPVLHVHDEIVAEVPEGWGSVEEMEAIMSEVPKWAEGMPISAEGYRAKRYRK